MPGRAVRPGQTVGFDASGSTDPDGPIAKYEWDIDGDGTFERTGVKVLGSYPAPTVAGVTLRVTDADGLTAVSGATLHVAADQAPTVAFVTPGKAPGGGRAVPVRRERRRPRRQHRRLRVRLRRQRLLRDRGRRLRARHRRRSRRRARRRSASASPTTRARPPPRSSTSPSRTPRASTTRSSRSSAPPSSPRAPTSPAARAASTA